MYNVYAKQFDMFGTSDGIIHHYEPTNDPYYNVTLPHGEFMISPADLEWEEDNSPEA